MSGGAFDYRNNDLFDLRDAIAREIGLYEYGCSDESYRPQDARTIAYMKLICEDLGKLGQVIRSLDWYLSGDTDEESFITDYEKICMKDK